MKFHLMKVLLCALIWTLGSAAQADVYQLISEKHRDKVEMAVNLIQRQSDLTIVEYVYRNPAYYIPNPFTLLGISIRDEDGGYISVVTADGEQMDLEYVYLLACSEPEGVAKWEAVNLAELVGLPDSDGKRLDRFEIDPEMRAFNYVINFEKCGYQAP